MKTATTTQNMIRTPSTCWVKTLSRSWAFSLFSRRLQWPPPAVMTVQHPQSPQAGCEPHPSAHTFSMLVESDILRGSRSVFP